MLLKPGFQKEYLPAFIKVARLLTCFDFRKDIKEIARIYGVSERAIRMHIRKLREENTKVSHIRVPTVVGLKHVIVKSRKRLSRNELIEVKKQLGYLANYKLRVDAGGRVSSLMIFLIPDNLVDTYTSVLLEFGDTTNCMFIPLDSCVFVKAEVKRETKMNEQVRQEVDSMNVSEWESTGYRNAKNIAMQHLTLIDKNLFLIFTAALDANPLVQRMDIVDAKRLPSLIPRKPSWVDVVIRRNSWRLKTKYDDLSSRRLLGRTLVWGVEEAAPLLVEVDASDAPLLHMLVSYYAVSDGVLVCDDGRAYAVVPALQRVVEFIRRLVEGAKARLTFLVGGLRFGLPLELWDYKKGVWLHPNQG